jgi:predicted transcriptional regulator
MLLSINPEHVENILGGTKRFEFRKARCRERVDSIVIYSTAPKMRVVAEVSVDDIIVGGILDVWHLTKEYAGISYKFYRSYYKGKKIAVAYKLGEVMEFSEPLLLSDLGLTHPPQSFAYLGKFPETEAVRYDNRL